MGWGGTKDGHEWTEVRKERRWGKGTSKRLMSARTNITAEPTFASV